MTILEPHSFPYRGEFNARWISPDEVARRFVATPSFEILARSTHTVLLGPRGSGKTTLLKMLTRSAQRAWSPTAEESRSILDFEGIYIPSDTRWSYELRDASSIMTLEPRTVELAQRFLVSTSVASAIASAFEELSLDGHCAEIDVCRAIAETLGLSKTLPTFRGVRTSFAAQAAGVRGLINSGDEKSLIAYVRSYPGVMTSHALDLPEVLTASVPLAYRWALLYDELEIAPEWLQDEILNGMRSVSQNLLLKATWSPMLPSFAPTQSHDFETLRLWYAQASTARVFCEAMTKRFLDRYFRGNAPTSDQFLQESVLTESAGSLDDLDSYARSSATYKTMVSLAGKDPSFHQFLEERGVDPQDPYSDLQEVRDTVLRKAKPLAFLRNEFIGRSKRRSRKATNIYSGKNAVYAVSEGNPRWLIGLLTDLCANLHTGRSGEHTAPTSVAKSDQALVVSQAAERFAGFLSALASPLPSEDVTAIAGFRLFEFVSAIGIQLREQFLGREFPNDPFGSFVLTEKTYPRFAATVELACKYGALVPADRNKDPSLRPGGRYRLTFLLAPFFKLPLRNYRARPLEEILARAEDPAQARLFGRSDEERE